MLYKCCIVAERRPKGKNVCVRQVNVNIMHIIRTRKAPLLGAYTKEKYKRRRRGCNARVNISKKLVNRVK